VSANSVISRIPDKAEILKLRQYWLENSMSTGIEFIDAQHAWLLLIINRVEQISETQNPQQLENKLQEILDELGAYIRSHFYAEELMLRELSFPGFEAHQKQHETFRIDIANLGNQQETDPMLHIRRVHDYLLNWLSTHIKRHDFQYRHYFHETHIDPSICIDQKIAEGDLILEENQVQLIQAIATHSETVAGVSNSTLKEVLAMWNRYSMRLYVPLLDMQHLWLIKIIIDLEHTVHTGHSLSPEIAAHLLPDVFAYLKEHFAAEETLMRELGYSDLPQHRLMHQKFREATMLRIQEYTEKNNRAIYQLVNDLKNWLVSHIIVEDTKFTKLCRENSDKVAHAAKQIIREKKAGFRNVQIRLYQYVIANAQPGVRR